MMELSKAQEDVLLEVCNVGMSKAAKQLSILLNGPVILENPAVDMVMVEDLPKYGWTDTDGTMSLVHQNLMEDITGFTLLAFKRDYTQALLEQVIGDTPNLSEVEMRSCEQEAMLEIGNIVISSCITAIVDMLRKKVGLSAPGYYEGSLSTFLNGRKAIVDFDTGFIMVLSTTMSTERCNFSGRLILFVSSPSIRFILDTIDAILKG